MQKTCRLCREAFEIHEDDLRFYDRVSPTFAGKKYPVPPPSLCPLCRQQRRLAWRNEQNLYSRNCDLCGKHIVSAHSPDAVFPVYCLSCWWSDRWDPLTYGLSLDLQKPFLAQFQELQKHIPQLAIQNDNGIGSENSEYCYDISRARNCYRLVGSWYAEECHYSLNCNRCKYVVDCNTVSIHSELAYECLDSQHLYHCAYLQNCENCRDCFFGYDLKGCRDCFGCFGLRQKQFYIFNKPCDPKEYREKLSGINLGSYQTLQGLRKKFEEWALKFPRIYANFQNCEDCIGNNLFNCKSVLGYSVYSAEYCKFIDRADGPKNCHDLINTGDPQWCYDSVTPDNSYLTLFSVWCWKSRNIILSDNCHSSENLLGCISLHRKKHCILNKQYPKKEYEELAGKVIESLAKDNQWGEHLPLEFSPFGYNESAANEYFPLDRSEVSTRGWKWTEELPYTKGQETISWEDVSDHIDEINDAITNEVLACTDCGRNYKIIQSELNIYRKIPAPLPRRCPHCRHLSRFRRKNPTNIWKRNCMKCRKPIETTYAPDRPEIVYCEECYLQTVY